MSGATSTAATEAPVSRRRSRRLGGPWVLLVALLVIGSGFAGYYLGTHQPTPLGTPAPSASLQVHVSGVDPTGRVSSLAGVVVDAFSVVPASLPQTYLGLNISSLPPAENPYYVLLGSGTTDSNGKLTIAPLSMFGAIETQWQLATGPPTANVSLQVDLTYVQVDGDLAKVYHAYDQVGYDPFVAFPALEFSTVMNLTSPAWTGAVSPVGGSTPPQSSCPSVLHANWSTQSFSVEHGNLPLALVEDNASGIGNDSAGLSYLLGGYTSPHLALGAVQYGSPGLIQASTVPSWTGTYPNFFVEGASAVSVPRTSSAVPMSVASISVAGVTYLIVNQLESVSWQGGFPCSRLGLNVTYVTVSVAEASTGLPTCVPYGCIEIFYSSTQTPGPGFALESLPNKLLLNQTTLAPGNSVLESAMLRGSASLAALIASEAGISGATTVFPINLGESVLAADLASGCDGWCSGNGSTAANPVLAAQFGNATGSLSSLAALAYLAPGGQPWGRAGQQIGFTNGAIGTGTTFSVFLFGGAVPTYFDANGTMLSANFPELGPIVCPAGEAPGRGC